MYTLQYLNLFFSHFFLVIKKFLRQKSCQKTETLTNESKVFKRFFTNSLGLFQTEFVIDNNAVFHKMAQLVKLLQNPFHRA